MRACAGALRSTVLDIDVRRPESISTRHSGLAVRSVATYVGLVSGDDELDTEFRFAESALKRGYSEEDLRRIVETDPYTLEWSDTCRSVPTAIVFRSTGWTSDGQYIEVLFATPDYGGGCYIFHAMPTDYRRPRR